jgi:hypothetical protein
LSEHERFEELAALAALGELSPEEQDEFNRHKQNCPTCSEIIEETASLAAATFIAGSPEDHGIGSVAERHRRLRENIARRLPAVVPISNATGRHTRLIAAGIAAAFVLGLGLGGAVGLRERRAVATTKSAVEIATAASFGTQQSPEQVKSAPLQRVVDDLRKEIGQTRSENLTLRDKLATSDHRVAELQASLTEAEKRSNAQAQEVFLARNELSDLQGELSQAREAATTKQANLDSLQYKLADREARLAEVNASLDREREMLSAGREIRDVMGARDLHIIDVVDRDGKGRVRKAFGRAFYTEGKSLIFYAFDLPAKNTADGKFVYAAWGSNSNNLNSKASRNLGIFYNDDQTQHRWAMKFGDPKTLQEIDTVFVTLEPADRPFTTPTGKPLLEAYFGTPPNHP